VILPIAVIGFLMTILLGYGELREKVNQNERILIELQKNYTQILEKLNEIDKKQNHLEEYVKLYIKFNKLNDPKDQLP
jgi:hypothetical protein